jgi:hypothetical protein
MSGFYTEDLNDISNKALQLGLIPTGYKTKNNWVAAGFKK